jgi:hypothetical protein
LSFLFILDKMRNVDEAIALRRLPPAYLKMVAGLPGPLKRVIARVATALLGKLGVPQAKIDHVVKMLKPRKVSKMFEILERNVKAERAARDAARDAYWKTQLQTERSDWQARESAWKTERSSWKTERDTWQTREAKLLRENANLRAQLNRPR